MAILNDDRRALVVDDITPFERDPFGDISIASPRSIQIAPGEQTEIGLRFRPSRTAPQKQTFQLTTNAGRVGPEGDFTVEAEGVEPAGETTSDRIEQQNQQSTVFDSSRGQDPLRSYRVPALTAIHDWARAAERRNQVTADWSRDNWEDFVGRTGGDYTLYRTDKLMQYVKTAVSKGITTTASIENPAVKLVAKQAVEALVGFFYDKLDGNREPSTDEKLAATANSVAHASIVKGREITTYRDQANLSIEDAESGAQLQIQQASSVAELDQWHGWATEQLAALPHQHELSDRSLRDQLLQEWVLQRAATPSRANKHTNPEAWKVAQHELKQSGQLATIKRSDLFIHQCRYEWSLLGLANVDAVVSELDRRRSRVESDLRAWGNSSEATARLVAALMSKQDQEPNVFTKSANPRQTASVFAADYGDAYNVAMGTPDELAGEFLVSCSLMLEADGDAVYVKRFRYSRTDLGDGRDVIRTPL